MIMEEKLENLVETIMSKSLFANLSKALESAEMTEELRLEGSFTIFAPINDAFEITFSEEKLKKIMDDKEKLQKLLKNHIITEKLTAEKIKELDEVEMMSGQKLKIDTRRGIKIGEAKVEKEDIEASNGIIHSVDKCILPK